MNHHMKKCKGQSSSQQNGETIKQEIKEESEVEDEINPLNFMISELCEDIQDDKNIEIKQEIDDSVESGDHTQHIDPSLNFVDCGEEIKKEIKEENLEVNETSEIDSLMIYYCDQCNKSFK